MAPKSSLVGPPELHDPTLIPKQRKFLFFNDSEAINDPFMNLMVSRFNTTKLPERLEPISTIRTEKGSVSYNSSGNPCLDFFFHVVPDSKPDSIRRWVSTAWARDPLTTLKLICNLRGVRGTGKNDKEGFYAAALWLHQLHPKTLACNLQTIADFGCLKDLIEFLYRVLEGFEVRKNQKAEWEKIKGKGKGRRNRNRKQSQGFTGPFQRSKKSKSRRHKKPESTRELRIANSLERDKVDKEKAKMARIEKKVAMAKKVYERYNKDHDFRFLYERVSDYFTDCLKADMEYLKSDQVSKISLAAKWCPSIDSSFDKSLLLCESIARKMFPRESYPEYEGVEEAHYAYRVRDRLRKEVLVPLRKVLELPEVYIGQKRWGEIPYNRVPSSAMKLYKSKFFTHDSERFSKFLKEAKRGTGGMLPVETVRSMNDDDGGQVADLQRKRMVDDLLKKGKLKNCMAICDVSKSMNGTPMEACLSLGVLVSELSEKPWGGKLITFSDNPTLQKVEGDSLIQKTCFTRTMEWGKNAKLQKVFDLILEIAVNGKLKEDEMIKRVFVFSDMEFDKASDDHSESDYKVIVRKFTEKGYGSAIPEVVFWNVRDSRATPVFATQKGVAMVSGFSKNLIKLFLDWNGEMDPVSVMNAAISGEEYQNLALMD